jgi:transposase
MATRASGLQPPRAAREIAASTSGRKPAGADWDPAKSPRHWVVERQFTWLLMDRRLSQDYEELHSTREAWIYLALPG